MNVIVRFYWQHDLDLIALNMHPDFDMGRWIKRAVIAYARKDWDFYIPLPRSMPYTVELGNCCTHFRLSPEKDADVIEFLNGFRSGFRNSAIKIILRRFLQDIYIDPFFNDQTYLTKSRHHSSLVKPGSHPELKKTGIKKKPHKPKIASAKSRPVKTASDRPEQQLDSNKANRTVKKYNKAADTPVKETVSHASDQTDDGFDIFGAIDMMMK